MTRHARLALGALAAPAIALALAGCSNPLATPSVEEALATQREALAPTSQDLQLVSPGTLTVGVRRSASAPLRVAAADGTLSGLDVDAAAALASQLGLPLRIVEVDGPTALSDGTCDVLMDATGTDGDAVTVAGAYAERGVAVFRKGASQGTVSAGALAGKSVAVQGESSSEDLLGRTGIDFSRVSCVNLNEAFERLDAGDADFVCCDALSGSYLASGYEGVSFAGTLQDPASVGFGVSSSNAGLADAVSAAAQALKDGGVSDVIRGRWLGGTSSLDASSKVSGVTLAATAPAATTTAASSGDDAEVEGAPGAQDGSTAGSNAIQLASLKF